MAKKNILKFPDKKGNLAEAPKKEKINYKRLFVIAIVLIGFIFPMVQIATQNITQSKYQSEIDILEQKIEENNNLANQITEDIDNSQSDEFIEKMARENLKMVKEDEIVYVKID